MRCTIPSFINIFRNISLKNLFTMPRYRREIASPYFMRPRNLNQNTIKNHNSAENEENAELLPQSSLSLFQIRPYLAQPDINARLKDSFFDQESITLAQKLLGKLLVRRTEDNALVFGRIVETEAYLGLDDKASHSYKLKKTNKNLAMFMKPGTAYVYTIHGYCCMNISSRGEGTAVLIRAVEPMGGWEEMEKRRKSNVRRNPEKCRELPDHHLCNGPAKLCLSFGIDKTFDRADLTVSEKLWLQEVVTDSSESIVTSTRIGLSATAEEWLHKPLRFYLRGVKSVSVQDKIAEMQK